MTLTKDMDAGMNTNDGDGLLAAILADPVDDVPRLIYADYLEEYGNQLERAEFIRLQIALAAHERSLELELPTLVDLMRGANLPKGYLLHTEWARLRRREPELLHAMIPYRDEHGRAGRTWAMYAWVPKPLWAFNADHWDWSRGFVHTVRLPLQTWLDHGRAICAAHPVEVVEISDAEPLYSGLDLPPDRPMPEGFYVWVKESVSQFVGRMNWEVPSELWIDELGGSFHSEEGALAALSRAALAFARPLAPFLADPIQPAHRE